MSTFPLEKKIQSLEEIEAYFQSSDMNLEEGIKKQEEALKLGKEILRYLDQAEERLDELSLPRETGEVSEKK